MNGTQDLGFGQHLGGMYAYQRGEFLGGICVDSMDWMNLHWASRPKGSIMARTELCLVAEVLVSHYLRRL